MSGSDREALEAELSAEEATEAQRPFTEAPRLGKATGPVPGERLVVDDRRSAGAWIVTADGRGLLDARSGLDHSPLERFRAYTEGTADLSGERARPARRPSASEAPLDAAARERAAERGVWLPEEGGPRAHAAFDDRARRRLSTLGDEATPPRHRPDSTDETRVRPVGPEDDVAETLDRIVALEASVYEPARRDPPAKLRKALDEPDGIAVLAERREGERWALVGFSLAVPLESVEGVDGVAEDPRFGSHDTLYALTTTLAPSCRGLGLGLSLKRESVRAAAALTDGAPRYRWISGRNRLGATAGMMRINFQLGAETLYELRNQYGGEGVAAYYRMPIGSPRPVALPPAGADGPIELASASRLLRSAPESYRALAAKGGLYGPWMSPVEPSTEWTTRAIERTRRTLAALTPDLPHVAFGRRYADLAPQVDRVAGPLRDPEEAKGGASGESRTAAWRGDPDCFFLARRPRAALWSPCEGLTVLHAKEPVADAGGDALTIVRLRHDLCAIEGRDRGPSPLAPLLMDLGFAGSPKGRCFGKRVRDDQVAMELVAEAAAAGVRLGQSRETVFAALPWDLTDTERARIEEVLRSVFG